MNKRIIAFLLAFLMAMDMLSGSVFATLDTTDPTEAIVAQTISSTEPVETQTEPATEPADAQTEPATEPAETQTEPATEPADTQTSPVLNIINSIGVSESMSLTVSDDTLPISETQMVCPYCDAAAAEDGSVTHADDCNTMFAVDASGDVGKTAAFTMVFGDVLYSNEKPTADFNYDTNAENSSFCFTAYDPDDPAFVEIIDWCWEVSGPTLWYRVKPLDGETLPDGLTSDSWILQRYTNDSDSIDTLVFPDTGKIGSYVRFRYGTAVLYETLADAYYGENPWPVDGTLLPAMVVKDLYSDGLTTWYYVDAAEGETWPESYGQCHYVPAKDMTDCEVCSICGKPNCTTQHILCDICGEYDCEDVHLYCLACAKFLCGKTHTYCGYCDAYDCTIDHLAENRPVTDPVLPDHPTMPEGMEVSIFDEQGQPVTNGLTLSDGNRVSLSAWSSDGEAAGYQWQICYDSENDLWTDIQGAGQQGILVSPAMVQSILELQGTAAIRCVMTVDGVRKTSPVIPVDIVSQHESAAFSLRSGTPALAAEQPGELKNAYVVVQYVYADGRTASRTENSTIIPGNAHNHTYEVPSIPGYKATLKNAETHAGHATLTDAGLTVTYAAGELAADAYAIFTVEYVPDFVRVTVIHFLQNVDNDKYTEYDRETVTTKYKTGDQVSDVHKDMGSPETPNPNYDPDYNGFYSLLYEEPMAAADGSTVIEVYYDRYYYLMRFSLGDMGYGVDPIYARFGDTLEIGTPTRAGYTFLGWKLNGTGDTIAPDNMPTTMPAGNQTYVAQWKMADTATVNVVIWGEKPNEDGNDNEEDDYSYQKTITIEAKSGETISWDTLQYYCGYTNHTHSASCGYGCGYAQEHTHSSSCYSCGSEEHAHSRSCYTVSGGSLANDASNVNPRHYKGDIYYTSSWGSTTYYLKIGNSYYQISIGWWDDIDDFSYSVNCQKAEHTHGSGCSVSCGLSEHTHTVACYACGKTEHTHSSQCENSTADMDRTLWEFHESDTVTVNPDGTTVLNVKFNRVQYYVRFYSKSSLSESSEYTAYAIKARWGANILDQWPTHNGSSSWFVEKSTGTWQNSIQIMPIGGANFNGPKTGSSSAKAYYYVEALPGDQDTITHNKVTYKLHHTDISSSSGNVTDEERYGIEGFTYKEGTANGSSYNNAKFYYTRHRYNLEFYNPTELLKKIEGIPYESDLSSYDFTPTSNQAPDKYEPGSVAFAGWYLNPDCTGSRFYLDGQKMPSASEDKVTALVLYAKWEPVSYKVNYYLTKESLDRGETIPAEMQRLTDAAVAGGVPRPSDDPYSVVFDEDIVKHGAYILNPSDPKVAEGYEDIHPRAGYDFIGWFYLNENGEETAFDPKNMAVTQELHLYGKWSANKLCKYNVYFALDANSDGIPDTDTSGRIIYVAEPVSGSGIAGRTYTFDARGGEALDPAYREGYFPTTGSHSIIIDITDEEGTGNNSFTFLYQEKPAVPYTVRYVDTATGEAVIVNGVPMADKVVNDNKNVVVTENFVYIPGYMPDAYQHTLVVTVGGENVITFNYTKDNEHALYVFNYYIQDLNTDLTHAGWSKYHSEQYTGIIGTEYSANAIAIDGFTLSPAYTDGYNRNDKINGADGTKLPAEVSNLTDGKITGTLTDKGMELNFYYTRNLYPYEFRYMLSGTTTKLAPTKVGLAPYDTVVTEAAEIIKKDLDGDGVNEDYSLYDPTETTKDIHIKVDGNPLSAETEVQEGMATVNVTTFYYVRCTQSMSITKTVVDKSAWNDPDPDPDQEFRFSLLIHAKDGYHRNSYDYQMSDGSTGTLTPVVSEPNTLLFTLKHGQTITIQGLPTAEYTLTELELPIGYYDAYAPAPQENGRYKLTVDDEVTVEVTNTYEPAGLSISKTVDIVEDNDNIPEVEDFVFTIQGPEEFDGFYLYDLMPIYSTDSMLSPENRLQATKGTATVKLKKGQRIRIVNLPEGDYTVTEDDYSAKGYNSDYSINGVAPQIQDLQASVTVVRGQTQAIDFVNRFPVGDLVIEKTVDKEFFRSAWNGDEFTFTVVRTTENRPLVTGNRYNVSLGDAEQSAIAQVDVSHKLQVTIPFDEKDAEALISDDSSEKKTLTKTLTIKNLPAGTYKVTEAASQDYTQTPQSLTVSGLVLPSENMVKASFTNTIQRKTGSLYLEKELVAAPGFNPADLPTDTKFSFTVELLEQIPAENKLINLTYSPATYSDDTAAATTATMIGGKFSVILEAGQNVAMAGLPEGMYRIIEATIPSYANAFAHITDGTEVVQPIRTTEDGQMYTDILVEQQIGEQTTAKVKCTNTYPVDRAELIIQKLVESKYPWDPAPGSFTFTVTLAENDEESYSYKIYDKNGTQVGGNLTAEVLNKQFVISLDAGQYAVIPDMPVCEYTVTETVDADKFSTSYVVYLSEAGETASTTVNTAAGVSASDTGASVTKNFSAGKTDAIVFTNEYRYAALTIEKQNAEDDQVFVYEVKNTVTNEVITVTVTGNSSTTIHGLIPGTYTVTQKNDWSWRYSDTAQSFELPADGKTITFGTGMQKDSWLDGNSSLVKNQYKPAGG